MLCNAHDDMSNFSIRSKHQRCYTGATPKSLHAIRSERQRALAPCDQPNPHNSRSKSGRQKLILVTIVVNSQQIRKAKINSHNNRDQFPANQESKNQFP